MHNKTLQRIFVDSWRLTLRNPQLWFFGLLASILISQEVFKGGLKSFYLVSQFDLFLEQVIAVYNNGVLATFFSAPLAQAVVDPRIHVFAISLALASILLIIYLAIYSQIQLIYRIDQLAGSLNYAGKIKIFGPMPPAFWGMIGIHFMFRLLGILLFVIASLPLMISLFTRNEASLILSSLVFFLIFVPGGLILDIIKNFALVNKALTLRGFVDSISYGWRLFRNNLLSGFETGALLILIRLILFSTIAIIFTVVLIPSMTALMILISAGQLVIGSVFISLVVIVLSATLLFSQAIYSTFDHSVWVMLYKRLHVTEPITRMLSIVESYVESFTGLLGRLGARISKVKDESGITARGMNEMSPEIEALIDRFVATAAVVNRMARPKVMAMRKEVEDMARREGSKILPKITKALAELEKEAMQLVASKKPVDTTKKRKTPVKTTTRKK